MAADSGGVMETPGAAVDVDYEVTNAEEGGVELGQVGGKQAPSPPAKGPPGSSSPPHEHSVRPPAYCYLLAGIACLNSCNLGYDVGSVGGAALLMRDDLGWTRWQLGVFVGSINFFCIPGALNAGYVCDVLGRRLTFTASCAIFIAGILIQVASNSFPIAMAGRVFVGLGVGLGLAIDPLYIAEVCPEWTRGHMVSLPEIAINLGIMLGFIADYAFLDLPAGVNWRVMLGLGVVMPSILMILTATIMPESPRWLVLKGRKAEAIRVLQRTYPPGSDLQRVVDAISRSIAEDEKADRDGWHAVLAPSPVVRRMLLAGVGLAACQQIGGTESFVYFSPEMLERAGFGSRQAAFGMMILIGLSKMCFTAISVIFSDHAGRRPLLLMSTAGLFASLIAMAVVTPYPALAGLMVFAICSYMAFFSMALGPLTWVGAAEVFPTRIRAKAMSLATSTNRGISGIVAATTLPLVGALGPRFYFLFYAALTALSGLYLWSFFPETKGRSLEQVEEHFLELEEKRKALRSRGSAHSRNFAFHKSSSGGGGGKTEAEA